MSLVSGLLPTLLPFLTDFIKGRSGNDLASLLADNEGVIADILAKVEAPAVGGVSGLNPEGLISAIAALIQKQAPVVVVPEGMKVVFNDTPATAVDKVDLTDILDRLSMLEANLADIGK